MKAAFARTRMLRDFENQEEVVSKVGGCASKIVLDRQSACDEAAVCVFARTSPALHCYLCQTSALSF